MFGLSLPHLILLAAIALIVIGPQQLPEVARMVGRFLTELKSTTSDLTSSLMDARDSTDASLRREREQASAPPEPIASVPSPHQGSPTPHLDSVDSSSPEAPSLDEHQQMSFDLAKAPIAPVATSSLSGGLFSQSSILPPTPQPQAVARPRPSFTIANPAATEAVVTVDSHESKDKNES